MKLDWDDTENQSNGRLFGEFFCKLEILTLYDKDGKLIAIPSVFAEGLSYLKFLSIINLFFEEIFRVNYRGQYVGTFECLTKFYLCKMPKLLHLWKENSEQGRAFRNLVILTVLECGRLKHIVPSSMYFRNLNNLEVSLCYGLISLATSSTAKSLVELKKLTLIIWMQENERNSNKRGIMWSKRWDLLQTTEIFGALWFTHTEKLPLG